MSLLIKALEQAAKDRDNAKAGASAPAPNAPSSEPTLEPPPAPRAQPTLEPSLSPEPTRSSSTPALEPAPPPRPAPAPSITPREPTPARANPTLTLDPSAASRLAAKSSASMANIDAQQQRARAATVMQASGSGAPAVWSYMRGNPVVMVGGLAALCGIAFGVYVYLQIAQPGLFVRQAATKPQEKALPPPLPSAQPAAPVATAPSFGTGPGPAESGSLPNPAVPIPGAPPVAPQVTGNIGVPPAQTASAASPSGPAGPVSAAAVIGSPAATDFPRETAPQRAADSRIEQGAIRLAPEAPSRATAAPAPAPAPSIPAARARAAASAATATESARGREPIMVTPAAQQPRLNPALSQAYAALQAGNLEESRSLYSRVVQSEPMNIDALLGMAYLAAQENRTDDAVKLYVRILQLNPRHAAAQAALIGVMGRADPVSAETRVKQLISREPSAFLHFVLGNVYADQALWPQAQQSYFQAHHLEPENPDYAYNLAVGLDHMRQGKVALGFYRRAEQLAGAHGRANFNLTHARERITVLSSQLE